MKTLKLNSSGVSIKYLQAILQKANILPLTIDGIFGNNTESAVKKFQALNNLNPNGIVNDETWNALLKHSFVPTDIPYISDILYYNIDGFISKFNFIKTGIIGNTMMEKPIPYIRIGKGTNHVLYVASTHANEWITSPVLMKFIEDFCNAYQNNSFVYDKSAKDIYNSSSIFIVPMLNIDGVDLVLNNIDKTSNSYKNAVNISANYPNISFPNGWKANINGIDLNLQFPAKWEEAKTIKFKQGYTTPAPRDFVGNYPLEASEAIAIYDFIILNNFNLMLTYHTQGQVIYWQFLDYNPPDAKKIGEVFSKLSGYSLEETPYSSSFAGLKDWFIQNYNKPAYTIEAGIGTNPLPISQFDKIYSDNLGILVYGSLLTV